MRCIPSTRVPFMVAVHRAASLTDGSRSTHWFRRNRACRQCVRRTRSHESKTRGLWTWQLPRVEICSFLYAVELLQQGALFAARCGLESTNGNVGDSTRGPACYGRNSVSAATSPNFAQNEEQQHTQGSRCVS